MPKQLETDPAAELKANKKEGLRLKRVVKARGRDMVGRRVMSTAVAKRIFIKKMPTEVLQAKNGEKRDFVIVDWNTSKQTYRGKLSVPDAPVELAIGIAFYETIRWLRALQASVRASEGKRKTLKPRDVLAFKAARAVLVAQ